MNIRFWTWLERAREQARQRRSARFWHAHAAWQADMAARGFLPWEPPPPSSVSSSLSQVSTFAASPPSSGLLELARFGDPRTHLVERGSVSPAINVNGLYWRVAT